jgi:aspartate carbamoyltransferase catalytic subunit
MKLRHVTSINDLTRDEIETVLFLADAFLKQLGDPEDPNRIGKSTHLCRGSIMATLFYEPSTRTRLSFEGAMSRLGGNVISSANSAASSAAKGESLADTVRMASAYADLLVIRHPREGAATVAAQYAGVPVINAGDGAHEHPTQTLCDLFAIRREKGALQGLTVAVLGDLKGGRTVHSLVYALARFGAHIVTMPASGMELPRHVALRLRHEFGSIFLPSKQLSALHPLATGAYLPPGATAAPQKIDVLYVTRFQKERGAPSLLDYPVVNADFLSPPAFHEALVLHPLPRVGELAPAFDTDRRAGYFRQASLGMPVRMALTALLLDAAPDQSLEPSEGGFCQKSETRRETSLACSNPNCITRDSQEIPNTEPKFRHDPAGPGALRCFYCEHEVT